ncbi:adenine specific DNA methylase Mod [Clostridium cochlearium]|uniref:Adenine specific DNA methylase Mod n=2 Tax=Clostridium cochlearium TaxID=1494 RepID=A0A2X2VQ75_CLOCO|nr:adenine specific DNA methylase Mod [Clostridium cochlearium]
MEKMDGYSLNIVKENISKLKEIFPEVFCEDKVDFERLQEVLGEYVEDREERYRFEWHGKSKAIRIAQTPSRGTLRPCKEESKNWDTTENLYIEGDNLEVLKLLQKSYQNKIKMIYIDPPYNTGNDFVYKDDYKDNLQNYLEITGQVDEEGNKTSTNSDTGGRYHTNWLNMMYPRLRLARNLLKDDGVIFISIDDNEVTNLRKICDEIYGESNFVGLLPTITNMKGNNDQFAFSGTHEYTLVYVKNKEAIDDLNGIPLDETDKIEYNLSDSKGAYKQGATLMRTGEAGARKKRPKGYYPIYVDRNLSRLSVERISETDYEIYPKTKDGKEMSWRRSKEFLMETRDEFIIKNSNGNISFYKKQRLEDDLKRGKKAKSLLYKPEYSSGNGTETIKRLFNERIFDNPKPVALIKDLINIGTNDEDIVLDFFSGSSTTAHATMKLNAEDGGNRKFIMVQLPDPTDEKSEAFKAGYKNICEIGKERIRRAGDKIVEENKDKEGIEDLDIGFKVFKLDSSNIKPWNPSYEDIANRLDEMVDNFVPGRTEEDVVYEIMLKYGIDLTYPIEVREVSGKKVFSIGFGALIICLDNEITLDVVNGIVDLKNELNPETTRIVFKDNGFKMDSVKTNAIEILKRNNINENEIMSI